MPWAKDSYKICTPMDKKWLCRQARWAALSGWQAISTAGNHNEKIYHERDLVGFGQLCSGELNPIAKKSFDVLRKSRPDI